MGNRAVIATEDKDIGIYVHWNGSRDCIDGFLAYCKFMKFRAPEDDEYGWARLVQTIANWFGPDGLSVGVNLYNHLDTDNGDQGVYIISDWKVVDRIYNRGRGKNPTSRENLISFLTRLSKCQPVNAQLNEKQIELAADQYLEMYAGDVALPGNDESTPQLPGLEIKDLPEVDVKSLPEKTDAE